jgi:hypothetical protein
MVIALLQPLEHPVVCVLSMVPEHSVQWELLVVENGGIVIQLHVGYHMGRSIDLGDHQVSLDPNDL